MNELTQSKKTLSREEEKTDPIKAQVVYDLFQLGIANGTSTSNEVFEKACGGNPVPKGDEIIDATLLGSELCIQINKPLKELIPEIAQVFPELTNLETALEKAFAHNLNDRFANISSYVRKFIEDMVYEK